MIRETLTDLCKASADLLNATEPHWAYDPVEAEALESEFAGLLMRAETAAAEPFAIDKWQTHHILLSRAYDKIEGQRQFPVDTGYIGEVPEAFLANKNATHWFQLTLGRLANINHVLADDFYHKGLYQAAQLYYHTLVTHGEAKLPCITSTAYELATVVRKKLRTKAIHLLADARTSYRSTLTRSTTMREFSMLQNLVDSYNTVIRTMILLLTNATNCPDTPKGQFAEVNWYLAILEMSRDWTYKLGKANLRLKSFQSVGINPGRPMEDEGSCRKQRRGINRQLVDKLPTFELETHTCPTSLT